MSEPANPTTDASGIEADYEPVTAEVIRRRLYNIAEEMGTAMIRTSGNPIISEAVDFSTFIADANGEIASWSPYLPIHSAPAREAVEHIRNTFSEGDIRPGDQFICNDPFETKVCHQPDVGVVKPIFHGDDLVAWCWSEAHMLDVGGMAPGGFAPHANESYAEALVWPGVKIVEEGEINDTVKRLIESNVRLPTRVFNDLRALIAANNRCDRRLQDTIEEFGQDTFEQYIEVNKDLTEAAFKERIERLPDGTYTTTETVEHDGHENALYTVRAEMTVDGSELTVDFSGSSPQAPGFINASLGTTYGFVMNPAIMLLGPDIPINEGMYRAIDIVAPEGTIVNPEMPAPTSSGHMETGMAISDATMVLFNRAMGQSEDEFVRDHVMGSFQNVFAVSTFYGENQHGEPDVFMDMNGGGAGAGACTMQDGLDAASPISSLNPGLPDLEINEDEHPMLYLWRRINADSGGPGEHRGGQGIEFAWTLHDVEGGSESVTSATTQVPTEGAHGGYPGSTTVFELARETDVTDTLEDGAVPGSVDDLSGSLEQLPAKEPDIPIDDDAVFVNRLGGGSGVGDPLLRDPASVRSDLEDGYITREMAEGTYGVVVADGSVDEAATEQRREELRAERTAWPRERRLEEPDGTPTRVKPFHRYVAVVAADGDEYLQCTECESVFAPYAGPDDTGWLDYTATNDSPIHDRYDDLSLLIQERHREPDVRLREHACPDCGTMFETAVETDDSA